MLKKEFPSVSFLQSKTNLGFAKANNEAYKVSKGRNLLFLNPDTEVCSGAILALFRGLELLSNAGIVGGKLLNSNRTVQVSCARVFPNIINQALENDIFIRLFPKSSLWCTEALSQNNVREVEVDAVSGACLMIRRSIFESVGMFSTDYFMYSEDIELCYKASRKGWKTFFLPEAIVVHHGGGSSSKFSTNNFSTVMMLESRFRFFKKTRSTRYAQFYRLAMFASSCVRILIILCSKIFFAQGKCPLSLENSLKKWTVGLKWTLGLEKWVKNY
jgi:GT2 family glycosyltransferase